MTALIVQKAPLDFGAGLSSAQSALSGAPPQVINLLRDASGYVRLAPGTAAWSWLSTALDSAVAGLTEFDGRIIAVTENRKIYKIEAPGLATSLGTLGGTLPPVFATTKTYVWIAGGGLLSYWTPTMAASATVTAAPTASHVVANASRLIVSRPDNSGQIQWTEANGEASFLNSGSGTPAGWDALNFAEAEARPDPGRALHENSDELFLFGTRTVQIFTPDENVGYAPAYTLNRGVGPAYSVINLLERRLFAWLTEDREFVMSAVRDDPQVISAPDIDATVKALPYIDDCRGHYVKIGNFRLLVWRFPTAGECFVYDLDAKRWVRFRGYDSTAGDYALWPVTAMFYLPSQNVTLAGLSSGLIHVLDLDAQTIGGQKLVGECTLGYESRGTEGPKQDLTLRLPLRRGLGTLGSTNPPRVEVMYRDRPGAWSRPVTLSLGSLEQDRPEIVKRIVTRPYTRRQYRLVVAAGVGVSIGPGEVTFEVLED